MLTANDHDTDGEYLLGVGVWGDISKAHTSQAAECKIQRRDVARLYIRTTIRIGKVYWLINPPCQFHEPAIRVIFLGVSNRVPDAGQPMSDQCEEAREKYDHRRAILRVAV